MGRDDQAQGSGDVSLDGRHDREPEFGELYRLMYEATRPGGPAGVSLTTATRYLYAHGVRVTNHTDGSTT